MDVAKRSAAVYAGGAFWTTSTCSNCTSDETKVSHMHRMIASKDAEIEVEDLMKRLAATEKQQLQNHFYVCSPPPPSPVVRIKQSNTRAGEVDP